VNIIDYLYDGTFEGFLTCVYLHYYEEKAAGIYPADSYQSSILQSSRLVTTDTDKAERVYEAIELKISKEALVRVYYIFLSTISGKDNIAFLYIRLGFKVGGSISSLHSHPIVFEAQQTAGKVSFEVHRLAGLVRFSVRKLERGGEVQEILYAKIEPDHDVLELTGEHFSDRFKNEAFIIHDARRKKGLFCQGGQWYIAPLDEKALPGLAEEEKEYRSLWKKYFEAIAIAERINPRCQKRMMPVRYWKNLTEMY
jgi:probable DNA metabolism protein